MFALRQAAIEDAPALGRIDSGPSSDATLDLAALGADGALDGAPFVSPVANFYMTNPIARASATMAECAAAASGAEKIAAE